MSKKKRIVLIGGIILVILAIIATILFFVTGKKDNDTNFVIKNNVKVITNETDDRYQPIGVDETSISFKNNPKYKKGDVIVAGIIEQAPVGFIRRIIDIKKDNGNYIYKTECAVLTDVFEEAHIIRSFAVAENQVYEIENPSDVNMTINISMNNDAYGSSNDVIQPMWYQKTSNNDLNLMQLSETDREMLFKKEFENEFNDFISVSGEVGFDVWFEVKIDIKYGNIEFGIVNHTTTEGEIFLGCRGEAFDKGEEKLTKPIFTKKLPNFQFSIGYVPIVITNDFVATLEVSAQIEGSIGTSIEVGTERTSGFEYNSNTGEITEINERKYLGDGLNCETSAKATGNAKAGIYEHLTTKLYGSTGADLAVGIMRGVEGELFAGVNSDIDVKYYGKLAIKVGPEIKGSIVVSVPIIDKKLAEAPLFVATLPLFIDEKWEKEQSLLPNSYDNAYVTNRSREHMVTCPEFTFDYSDNWKIKQEELKADYEWDILENDVV